MINRLIELKQEKIVIIDNGSTYEPLLQYYREIEGLFEIMHMHMNHGHSVMTRLFRDDFNFRRKYRLDEINYIYSDCDIVPEEECPKDFIEKFHAVLQKYKVNKVGFGIKIDDLPESFEARDRLIKWESQFWRNKIHDEELGLDLYPAAIDTTFACRRAGTIPRWTGNAFRTGPPYVARHLPWYIDSKNLSEEDRYYSRTTLDVETHFPGRYFSEPKI
jgi:hypothetical protein